MNVNVGGGRNPMSIFDVVVQEEGDLLNCHTRANQENDHPDAVKKAYRWRRRPAGQLASDSNGPVRGSIVIIESFFFTLGK